MEKRLIDANWLKEHIGSYVGMWTDEGFMVEMEAVLRGIDFAPAIDAVEVVRCQNCIHSEPFERNCELNSCAYMHCKILRGEEVRNVWHKYKKYYRDYSVVDRDGFCDEGERRIEDAAD